MLFNLINLNKAINNYIINIMVKALKDEFTQGKHRSPILPIA